jgi:hypothetical protein
MGVKLFFMATFTHGLKVPTKTVKTKSSGGLKPLPNDSSVLNYSQQFQQSIHVY